jgi:succinate-semialdehyde dehydrogenase/glutarate-semialdehyde dehydrogenase
VLLSVADAGPEDGATALDAAVAGAMLAKLRNMGEACTAANRFIMHESVAAEFAEKLSAKMKEIVIARGTEPESRMGPLIDEKSRNKVHELVSHAVASGAKVVLGGFPMEGPGYFYQPTLLSGLTESARILSEEIFGPVASIITFRSEDDAVRLANNTEYGLVAYVFTTDLNRGIRMGEKLETGMLGLNAGVISNAAAPFGGVKQSGLGREGGLEGIDEYLYTQYIGIADPYPG